MRVVLGFSGEMTPNQWRKGDVEIDEVDLSRILIANDINMVGDDVPHKLAFIIMEAEAAQLMYAEMMSYGGNQMECKTKMEEASKRQQQALDMLRS